MTTGLPLFDLPTHAPHVRGSTTSALGAAEASKRITQSQLRVLEAIATAPEGLTDNQGIALTGLVNGYRARRVELQSRGLIQTHGTRPGSSGVANVVWVASDLGRGFLESEVGK